MIRIFRRDMCVLYLRFVCGVVAVVLSPDRGNSLAPQDFEQAAAPQESDSSEMAVKQWIQELHADRSLVRQNAYSQLVQVGVDAIGPLIGAIEKGNQDEQIRIMTVLNQLALIGDEKTADIVRRSLLDVAKDGSHSARGLAINALTRLGAGMEDSAVKDLAALGAKISASFVSNVKEYTITLNHGFGQRGFFRRL